MIIVPHIKDPKDKDKDCDLSSLDFHEFLSDYQKVALYAGVYGRLNAFITGSSGTGKSAVLNCISQAFAQLNLSIQFTSSTGISATVLPNATTFHSFLGIGTGEGSMERVVDTASSNLSVQGRIELLDALVVDEVSMLSPRLIELAHRICSRVRKSTEPFGGLQMLFVGDFGQLSPVQKTSGPSFSQVQSSKSSSSSSDSSFLSSLALGPDASFDQLKYAFQHPKWSEWIDVSIPLQQVFRQSDRTFIDMLNRIRFGLTNASDMDILKRKCREGDLLVKKMKSIQQRADIRKSKGVEKELGEHRDHQTYQEHSRPNQAQTIQDVMDEILQRTQSSDGGMNALEFYTGAVPVLERYLIPDLIEMVREYACETTMEQYIFMYGTNNNVDRKNTEEMAKLKTLLYKSIGSMAKKPVVERTFKFKSFFNKPNAQNKQIFEAWLEDKKRNCLSKPEITLLLGCKVMVTVNLDPARDIVNGSSGFVVGFSSKGNPIVRFQMSLSTWKKTKFLTPMGDKKSDSTPASRPSLDDQSDDSDNNEVDQEDQEDPENDVDQDVEMNNNATAAIDSTDSSSLQNSGKRKREKNFKSDHNPDVQKRHKPSEKPLNAANALEYAKSMYQEMEIPPYKYMLLDEKQLGFLKNKYKGKEQVISALMNTISHVVYEQLPLRVSYAMSVHKSQGQTIKYPMIDAGDMWSFGQFYVALSRAQNLDNMLLLNFAPKCIKTDPSVKTYYDGLENQQWMQTYESYKASGKSESECLSECVRFLYLQKQSRLAKGQTNLCQLFQTIQKRKESVKAT